MALVSLPFTLTAGQPENVNNLNSNLTALVTGVNNIDAANITDGSIGVAELATAVTDLLAPIGALLDYGGSTDPVAGKWILADGRAISRSTYASLFTIMGTTYGIGDNLTTFNVPDLRGRVSVGPDNMGTAQGAASRMSDNNTRGASSGAASVTLSTNQIPAHQHTYSNSISGSITTNASTTGTDAWVGGQFGITQYNVAVQPLFNVYIGSGSTLMSYTTHTHSIPSLSGTFSGTSSGTTNANTTTGTAVDNRQPYQVINKIIRIA